MMIRRLSYLKFLASPAPALALIWLCCGTGCQWHGMYGPGGYTSYSAPMVDGGCDSCGESHDGCCTTSGPQFPGSCGSCSPGQGGFSGLMLPLLCSRLGGGYGCGSGCGDTYWGEWIFDPPVYDQGGWAGSDYDGSYDGYGDAGYGYGYGDGGSGSGGCVGGLLGGPAAVLRGTYLGVTSVVQGTMWRLHNGISAVAYGRGYRYSQGYDQGYGQGYSSDCGSCGQSGCDGGCAQVEESSIMPLVSQPQGSGVRRSRVQEAEVTSIARANSSRRRVARRLRR